MEKERVYVNSDKVKKLQETIKKLELQNEQLRAQHLAKNGLVVSRVCDNNVSTDSNRALDDDDIIPLNEKDLSDDQTWLYVPEKASESDTRCDIEEWLRGKVEGNDNNVRNPRNSRMLRNSEIDHGIYCTGEKQSIDTRTFTRPKKRMGILSTASMNVPDTFKRKEEKSGNGDLSTMLQSAGLPLKGVLDSILQKHKKTNLVGVEAVIESEDSVFNDNSTINKLDSTFMVQESAGLPLKGVLGGILQKHRKANLIGVEAVNQSEENLTNDNSSRNKLESTFVVPEDDEPDIVLSARKVLHVRESSLPRRSAGLGSTGVKGSCPALDQTFQVLTYPQPLARGKRETGSTSILDCTFSLTKGNSPHSEEDCLSTTSDGSLSSSSRPMNVDDVQQIARLQEESLKQSTPVRGKKNSILEHNVEDLPSPIPQGNGSDDNHGYHSDRSSPVGSLTDGGRGPNMCSQGSSLAGGDSLHSSPMTSPHSSTQTLHQIPSYNGLQSRDNKGHHSKTHPRAHSRDNIYHSQEDETILIHNKEEIAISDGASRVLNVNSGTNKLPQGVGPPLRTQSDQVGPPLRSGPGRGGIRPPSAPSGIPRPQSRFQSRIPAPTQRIPGNKTVQKKPAKSDWMDGCY